MRTLLAGNWKMNGLHASLAEIRALVRSAGQRPAADIVICPPATLIAEAARTVENAPVEIGGQDCHAESSGAFTGEISAEMLRDAGATAVIVGHSERRQYHGETDGIVATKLAAASRAGLEPILCIGESEAQRDRGQAVAVVRRQLSASMEAKFKPAELTVAYEPVWAIGTGRTPGPQEIVEMHEAVRAVLIERFGQQGAQIRILYGGSVKPDNAGEILSLPGVGGALIGGASLKAADFLSILQSIPSR
ncbi:MAG TPA: triose-phosphate isomerase [Micropepsaceae bacterium]|nr:triose-phosphate isomerase [Micropepsaceae bacterium]